MMRRRVTTIATVLLAVAAGNGLAVAGPVATAAGPGGPIHLYDAGATRVHDGLVGPGDIAPVHGLGGHYIQLGLPGGYQAGSAEITLGPCGGQQRTVLLHDTYTEYSLQYVAPGDCATYSGDPRRLVIDDLGVQGAPDGSGMRYFDLDQPRTIYDSMQVGTKVRSGELRVPLTSAALPANARAVALRLDATGASMSFEGYLDTHACGVSAGTVSLAANWRHTTSNVAYVRAAPGTDVCIGVSAPGQGTDLTVAVLGYFTDAAAVGVTCRRRSCTSGGLRRVSLPSHPDASSTPAAASEPRRRDRQPTRRRPWTSAATSAPRRPPSS